MSKTNSSLSAAEIKKYKKLQDKAEENTNKTGYFIDEFEYCYGNLAEDLIYDANDKEWAIKIYKIVEDRIGIDIDGSFYLSFAGAVSNDLGDKEWAKKIYKDAEESNTFSAFVRCSLAFTASLASMLARTALTAVLTIDL